MKPDSTVPVVCEACRCVQGARCPDCGARMKLASNEMVICNNGHPFHWPPKNGNSSSLADDLSDEEGGQ